VENAVFHSNSDTRHGLFCLRISSTRGRTQPVNSPGPLAVNTRFGWAVFVKLFTLLSRILINFGLRQSCGCILFCDASIDFPAWGQKRKPLLRVFSDHSFVFLVDERHYPNAVCLTVATSRKTMGAVKFQQIGPIGLPNGKGKHNG